MARPLTQAERTGIEIILRNKRDALISELNAKDPGWSQRIEDRKRKVAIGRLKVQKEVAELEDLESQRRDISQRIDAIEVKIKKKMPLGERTYRHSCPDHKELCEAISDISQEIHDQEMSKDKTGKQKLKIEKEFHSQMARLAECDTRQEVAEKGIVSA